MKKYGLIFTLLLASFSSNSEINAIDDRIFAEFKNYNLQEVLEEVSINLDIKITTNQDLSGQMINRGYESISAKKMLASLLKDYNVIYLTHKNSNRIKSIRILSGKGKPVVAKKDNMDDIANGDTVNEDGSFYKDVIINDKPVRMLIDSGASYITIPLSLANSLGISIGDVIEVNTAAGRITGNRITLDKVQLANITLSNVAAVALDGLEKGLLGQNVLKHFRQEIENGKMKISAISDEPTETTNKDVEKTADDGTKDSSKAPAKDAPNNTTKDATKKEPVKETSPKAPAKTPTPDKPADKPADKHNDKDVQLEDAPGFINRDTLEF